MAVSLANSPRLSWRAIWWVRSRELHLNVGFWLILLGYDPRKRAFENPLYGVYAVIFFALWGFMVLLLLADYAGKALLAMTFLDSPVRAAQVVGALAWLVLLLVGLYRSARRSPAVFSDADAQLLVMAPVNRRMVGLAWFGEAWLWRALWVWPVAIVLGYALVEATTPVELTAADLPQYLLAGLRMLSAGIPLHLAADSLAWAAGVWRLQGSRDRRWLRYLAPLLGLLLLAALSVWGPPSVEILVPLTVAIAAGLGQAGLLLGWLAAWLLATAGVLLLQAVLPGFSLARAAQETRGPEGLRGGGPGPGAAQDTARQRRLGAGRTSRRLPFRRGVGVIVSRSLIERMRTLQISDWLAWAGLGALPLGLALVTDWGVQVWIALSWVLLFGQRVERALRETLSRWWLLRGLPFQSEAVLLAELALPLGEAWLAVLLGLAAAWGLGLSPAGWVVVLAFPGTLGVALAAAVDLLRQAKSGQVLAGFSPAFSFVGVLLAALVLGLPAGLYWLAVTSWNMLALPAYGVVIIASLALDTLFWQWGGSLLREIK